VFKFFVVILCTSLFTGLMPSLGMSYCIGAAGQKNLPEDDVVHIKTAEQLAAIGGEGSEGKYYVLDNDINLIDEWVPIEDFNGTFDGQGYTINNLYVLESSNIRYAGLFGATYYGGGLIIKNVGVHISSKGVNSAVPSGVAFAGGLIGYSGVDVTVENSYVTGDVVAITSGDSLNYDGAYAGGLIGLISGVTVIENSYTTSNVVATSVRAYIGAYAGGLVGHNNGDPISGFGVVTVANSYVTGDITATSTWGYAYAGGLIGHMQGSITAVNSYATGDISANSSGHNAYAGDLVGYTDGSVDVSSCYSLSTQKIIGDATNAVGVILTPEEMRTKESFIGWDFETVWVINSKINEGYPYLKSLVPHDTGWPFGFIALTAVVIMLITMGVIYVLLKNSRSHS